MIKKLTMLALLLAVTGSSARDILVEFKGAYFKPTGKRFKHIYKGGALYGPELTVQLSECSDHWYGFLSVDYYSKKGYSIGLHNPTKVSLLPIGIGIKYFVPSCWWNNTDFYVGLGFQPIRVHTHDFSPFVIPKITKWAFGGIAKAGAYINFSCNFFLDLFIDYSFARASSKQALALTGPVVPLRSSVSGVIFGAGLGYRF
jgi:hypothetical protein